MIKAKNYYVANWILVAHDTSLLKFTISRPFSFVNIPGMRIMYGVLKMKIHDIRKIKYYRFTRVTKNFWNEMRSRDCRAFYLHGSVFLIFVQMRYKLVFNRPM